ncbi:MAG: L,D-transpeptidase [Planctomycetota bacterium]
MHSIKNTIVAVGLLGLSFVFYQLSSGNKTTLDLADPQQVADGSMVDNETSTEPSSNASAVEVPEFLKSGTATSPQPIGPTNQIDRPAANLNLNPNLQSKPDAKSTPLIPRIEAPQLIGQRQPQLLPNQRSQPLVPQPRQAPLDQMSIEPVEVSTSSQNNFGSTSNSFSIDPVERDRGLIDALESQKFPAPDSGNSSIDSGSFSMDNSFTKKAGDFSDARRDANVVRPDALMPKTETPKTDMPRDYSNVSFQEAWPIAQELVQENRLKETLRLLSRFYRQPDLTGPQRQRLNAWLDGLAGKVIFSAEHRLAQPYVTKGNETLDQLAEHWNVPPRLIYQVNQSALASPKGMLEPGIELKRFQGPFHADVDLKSGTMTLFVGELYAGRFPVRMGISGQPGPGSYGVMMKSQEGQNWVDANGNQYPPSSPNNGYGPFFLGLQGHLCIHAIDDDKQDGHYGCIGLSPRDAEDIFHILNLNSKVTLR